MRFTATQQRIVDLLSDGKPHLREKVRDCLPDYLSSLSVLKVHIAQIRQKLPLDQNILCVFINRRLHYQHVILLSPRDNKREERRAKSSVHS